MADRFVVIEHKDGRTVAVRPADFKRAKVGPEGESYEALGFKIARWETGEPFEEPEPPAKKSAPSGG